MRILYGVHGYGRGHATRTLAVLPHLARRHQLLILAGGDAYHTIGPEYPVVRIPTFGFAYRQAKGPRSRSNWETLRFNLPGVLDLFWGGPTFQLVRELVQEFAPDVVISDAEAWSHQVAAFLAIPRISFDHIGILTYCRPRLEGLDRFKKWLDTTSYRLLMGRPDRVIVSSFFDAPPRYPGVQVVGTLPRQPVRQLNPYSGDHLLVYLNRGQDLFHEGLVHTLNQLGCPVHVYGSPYRGREGRLVFLPTSHLPFLEDLAGCRAVISTAGNQLVGEAIYLGKPVLVFPESCVEQRMNALAVKNLGIGMRASFHQFTPRTIGKFLSRLDEFAANVRQLRGRDGLPEALRTIDQFLSELVPSPASAREEDKSAAAVPVSAGQERGVAP
jgi:uncharacterized protein (TIGR00661 family)